MATPDCFRGVARTLSCGFNDVLPLALRGNGSVDHKARHMTTTELHALVNAIRKEDPSQWTLAHLLAIASVVPAVDVFPATGKPSSAKISTTAPNVVLPPIYNDVSSLDRIGRLKPQEAAELDATTQSPPDIRNLSYPSDGTARSEVDMGLGAATAALTVTVSELRVPSESPVLNADARQQSASESQRDTAAKSGAVSVPTKTKIGITDGADNTSNAASTTEASSTPNAAEQTLAVPSTQTDDHPPIQECDVLDSLPMPKDDSLFDECFDSSIKRNGVPTTASRITTVSRIGGYSTGELASLLKKSVGNELAVVESIFRKFCDQTPNTTSLDYARFGELVEHTLEGHLNPSRRTKTVALTDEQLTSLFELVAGTSDEMATLKLRAFTEFFCESPDDEIEKHHKRFSIANRGTISTIDMTSDESAVAFGGSDCTAKVFSLRTGGKTHGRKFGTSVTSIVLNSCGSNVGVSCTGGFVHWYQIGCVDDHIEIHHWSFQNEVNALALSLDETMLAVGGADGSARLYSLDSGKQIYRFFTRSSVYSVCMSEATYFNFELEDGRVISKTRYVTIPDTEQPFEVAFKDETCKRNATQAFMSLSLNGHVLQLSDKTSSSEWAALHRGLNSRRAVLVVTALVLSSFILTLLHTTGGIEQDGTDFHNFLSVVLGIEFTLRALSHKLTLRESQTFIKNPLNWIDFLVTCFDIFAAVLASRRPTGGALLAVIRFTRSLRSVRLLRVFRLAHHVSRKTGIEELRHDVQLEDGTILRNVANDKISAKVRINASGSKTSDKHIAVDRTAGRQRRTRERRTGFFFNTNAQVRYEAGVPVSVCLDVRVIDCITEKFVGMGCEDGTATVWQYDMSTDQVVHWQGATVGRRGSGVEEQMFAPSTAARNSRSGSGSHSRGMVAASDLKQLTSSRSAFTQQFSHAVNRCGGERTAWVCVSLCLTTLQPVSDNAIPVCCRPLCAASVLVATAGISLAPIGMVSLPSPI